METNVNYTIVGAFVIVMLTAIILAIIWLSSGFSLEEYNLYLVYMQESVSGLSIDSQVEYNGVAVGTVKDIELNQKNPSLVELILSIKNSTPITRGTVATLNTRGLTGMGFIALKDKSTDLRPLVKEPGEKYPVIPTAPSLFMRLDAAMSALSKNFKEISQSIQSLLDKENLRSIKGILHNMRLITAKTNQQIGPLMQSTTGTFNTLHNQTLPAAYRFLNNLDDVTRTLSEVSNQLKQNPSILLRGAAPPPLGPGESK